MFIRRLVYWYWLVLKCTTDRTETLNSRYKGQVFFTKQQYYYYSFFCAQGVLINNIIYLCGESEFFFISFCREREKSEIKDRNILEILQSKDEKIEELQILLSSRSKEIQDVDSR